MGRRGQTVDDIMEDYRQVSLAERDKQSVNGIYALRFLQNIASTLERIEEKLERIGRTKYER